MIEAVSVLKRLFLFFFKRNFRTFNSFCLFANLRMIYVADVP